MVRSPVESSSAAERRPDARLLGRGAASRLRRQGRVEGGELCQRSTTSVFVAFSKQTRCPLHGPVSVLATRTRQAGRRAPNTEPSVLSEGDFGREKATVQPDSSSNIRSALPLRVAKRRPDARLLVRGAASRLRRQGRVGGEGCASGRRNGTATGRRTPSAPSRLGIGRPAPQGGRRGRPIPEPAVLSEGRENAPQQQHQTAENTRAALR